MTPDKIFIISKIFNRINYDNIEYYNELRLLELMDDNYTTYENFDWKYYLDNNKDILINYYWKYWKLQGKKRFFLKKKDGELNLENFDWEKYANFNKKLHFIIYTKKNAYQHYKDFGMTEGRDIKVKNKLDNMNYIYIDIIKKSIAQNYKSIIICYDNFNLKKDLKIVNEFEFLAKNPGIYKYPPIYLESNKYNFLLDNLKKNIDITNIFKNNINPVLTLKPNIVSKKICLFLRGHVRSAFDDNKLYEFVSKLNDTFKLNIFISCWNCYNINKSWENKSNNTKIVEDKHFFDYFKDCSGLIKKVLISDNDCYKENCKEYISNSKMQKYIWNHMWKGMLDGINIIDDKYDVILNCRLDLFNYNTDIGNNINSNFVISNIINYLNNNQKYGFLNLDDKPNDLYCGIDNFFMSNLNNMKLLINEFYYNVDTIINNNPPVSYQEFLVKYYCDKINKNKTTLIISMVKDEIDIIESWINYHGSIFGYDNLFIIDNYSTDGTFEILEYYNMKFDVNIIRLNDYKKKGFYMTEIIKRNKNYKFYFPIDIDEFIVLNNDSNLKFDLQSYLENLYSEDTSFYKMKTIQCKCNNIMNIGPIEKIISYSNYDKTFLKEAIYLDMGNHCPNINFKYSDIFLLHIPYRNLVQIKKKTINNLLGLNYDVNDLEKLKDILKKNSLCPGNQHIKNLFLIEENNNLNNLNFQDMKGSKEISEINISNFTNYLTSIIPNNLSKK